MKESRLFKGELEGVASEIPADYVLRNRIGVRAYEVLV